MDASLNETRMKLLGELAEMGMVLARDIQQAALLAEDMDEKVRLAEAFHRVGRGVRQSLALHARLERDLVRAAREDEAQVISLEAARRTRRKAQVKAAVERLVWTEEERLDDPEDLIDRLDALLDAESDTAEFLDEEPDVVIARLCEVLKLTPSTVIPRSGGTPDPGDPSRLADTPPQLGSPASPCGRAEDDAGGGAFRSSA